MPLVIQSAESPKPRRLVRDPVYFQLCDLLRDLVRSGEFKAGQQFLTEREVGEKFGISRVTANKALSHLVVEGLLEFRKGVGTFVRGGGLDYDLHALVSFTRRASLGGKVPRTQVLAFQTCEASQTPEAVRGELGVKAEEWVYYFERLRMADDVPVILERRYLVAKHCPHLKKQQLQGSLYTLLTDVFGVRMVGADQVIRALELSREDARVLRVPARSAALWVHGLGVTEQGEPLWVEDTLYRGDCCEFHNRIGSHGAPRPARPSWGLTGGKLISKPGSHE